MGHWHTVGQGESVPSIAAKYGFFDWKTIYEHDGNEPLRSLRTNPYVLAPGDRIFIPSKEARFVEVAAGSSHRFQLRRRVEQISLVLEDEDGEPMAGARYRLTVGDHVVEGQATGEGKLDEEVPAVADEAELEVWPEDAEEPLVWTLEIGWLDPADTIEGMQARLANIGFYSGEPDGDFGDLSRAALVAFQREAGLDPTGEYDEQTREKLLERHGS